MEENKYQPLSESDFKQLEEHLKGIKNHLPDHLMSPFWMWCNMIRNTKTPQPCSCASSARHWGSCVEELRAYIKRVNE